MKETWGAPHIREMMKMGSFFGENGHPDSEEARRIVTIDPKLCCHRIIDYEFKGKAVYGTVETLNDELYGKQFMGHILQGCMAAFSFRGLVPLTKIDAVRCEVRSKGHMIAEDRVILPSHKEAYQQPGEVEMVVGESYTPTGQTNNNLTIPVTENTQIPTEFMQYMKDESFNMKTVVDHFDVAYESMTMSKDGKFVTLTEAPTPDGFRRRAIVKTDDYLVKEMENMFYNLY
jgi:hypothetical protein